MAQDSQKHKDNLYAQIQEQYGKVLYTYTCHWKTADHLKKAANTFKWMHQVDANNPVCNICGWMLGSDYY